MRVYCDCHPRLCGNSYRLRALKQNQSSLMACRLPAESLQPYRLFLRFSARARRAISSGESWSCGRQVRRNCRRLRLRRRRIGSNQEWTAASRTWTPTASTPRCSTSAAPSHRRTRRSGSTASAGTTAGCPTTRRTRRVGCSAWRRSRSTPPSARWKRSASPPRSPVSPAATSRCSHRG